MFKLISGLVAGAIVLAPMLPAWAGGFGHRSSGFGITIGSPSSFGVRSSFGRYPRGFQRGYYPYGGSGVVIRSTINKPYYNYGQPGYYSPRFPTRSVIVAPRVRTVIVNPGYRSNCGSVIYGSPIASPIPVDPYTGLACR
jgi:hypothetical protein